MPLFAVSIVLPLVLGAAPADEPARRPFAGEGGTIGVQGLVSPAALLARAQEHLVSTDRLRAVPADWKITAGRWNLVDGELRGEEIPAQRHGAGIWLPVKAANLIVAYEIRVGPENRNATMSLNAPGPRHLCRVVFEPNRIVLRKPDQDRRGGPDEQMTLDEYKVDVEPGRWYSVVVEASGEDVLVRIDGKARLFGSHKAYAAPKTLVQLTAGGGDAVSYRNVHVWKAALNPDWPKIREATLAERNR